MKGMRHSALVASLRRCLIIVVAPVAFLGVMIGIGFMLLAVVIFLPVGLVYWLVQEQMLRRQMRAQGRLLSMADLRPRLEAGEGTLIEETGHKGPYHIWWTEDDLRPGLDLAKEEIVAIPLGRENTFNSRYLEEYLDPQKGKAYLTAIRPHEARSGTLSTKYPRMPVAKVVRPLES